jgi:hypothetical protein
MSNNVQFCFTERSKCNSYTQKLEVIVLWSMGTIIKQNKYITHSTGVLIIPRELKFTLYWKEENEYITQTFLYHHTKRTAIIHFYSVDSMVRFGLVRFGSAGAINSLRWIIMLSNQFWKKFKLSTEFIVLMLFSPRVKDFLFYCGLRYIPLIKIWSARWR